MPTNDEVNALATMLIDQYEDDCLYVVAEKLNLAKNIHQKVIWGQIMDEIIKVQSDTVEVAC